MQLQSLSPIPVNTQTLVRSFSKPSGKIYLLHGESCIFRLSLLVAAQTISTGTRVAVVDGCNRFDVHALTRFARERKLDPDTLLNRIFITRGFTCYQMEAAVSSKLPMFLKQNNAKSAMIFGLLDTFYDEQAPLHEVRQILVRLLHTFQGMKNDGVSLLLACTQFNVLPKERNLLFQHLKTGMDRVYHLAAHQENKIQLFLEQPQIKQKGNTSHGKDNSNLYEHHRK